MARLRVLLAALLAIAVCNLAVAVVATADSGPSAGDNQYIDPLAGTKAPKKHKQDTSTTTTTSPGTTTGSGTTTATPTTAPTTTAPTTTAVSSTTASTTSTGKDPKTKSRTLPFTGLDTWLIAGLGLGLVGLGAAVRRVAAE